MVALPAIRDSFGLSQAQASGWIALLFLGALPAVFLARRADRRGRRRLLLFSITGYTLATAATALAPGIVAFGICQLCARAFLGLELTLTWTLLAEELPAGTRGYGFGVLAMLDAMGAGAGALAWGLLLAPPSSVLALAVRGRRTGAPGGGLPPPQASREHPVHGSRLRRPSSLRPSVPWPGPPPVPPPSPASAAVSCSPPS